LLMMLRRLLSALLALASPFCGLLVSTACAGFGSEIRQLTVPDGGTGGPFGNSVDLSGTTAVIGHLGDDSFGEGSGAAYVFVLNTGAKLSKLTADDAAGDDSFGTVVTISGEVVVVGANLDDDHGNGSGSAYVFDATTGQQQFKLTASDAGRSAFFGHSVDVSGHVAIVGAHGNGAAGFNAGAAYLFDVTNGQQLFQLTASDAHVDDWFGWSVGISGNVAIVGARYADEAGVNAGAAYLFDVATGQQLFKLTAEDAAPEDDFGWSVAINGDRAIVGAHLDDDNGQFSGSAYVFDVTTGDQLAKLTASDSAAEDEFGRSVAIFGQTAIVGSSHNKVNGFANGSAYLFDIETGEQLVKLTANNAMSSSFFGSTVALNDRMAIVGAPYHQGQGTAYVFDVPEPDASALLALAFACAAFRRSSIPAADAAGYALWRHCP
ncbi:MAG: FG-GAP repeat protein, partial [Planctomycetales bacterium]|nr:FG-GAP repeat protein [Planctomycetales bacterium]